MNCDASIYDQANALPIRDGMELINKIENDLTERNFEIILDIGCGSGNLTIMLDRHFPNAKRIYGVDIDEDMIEFAKQNNSGDYNNIQYFIQNFGVDWNEMRPELKAIEGRVSLIFTNHCLQWVYTTKDNVFNNMNRLLAKNGRIYAHFLCIPLPLSNSNGWVASIINTFIGVPNKEKQINEWNEIFKKLNLNVLENKIIQKSYQFEQDIVENYVIPNGSKIYEQFLGNFKYSICRRILAFVKIKPKNIFRELIDQDTDRVMYETSYEQFSFSLQKIN